MTIEALVGNEVFLQNKYLDLGISNGGSLGTRANAPSGFYTNKDIGYVRVGLYADFDGFGVGQPSTVNDGVLKGTAVEGFSIGYKSGGNTIVQTNHERAGKVDIDGKSGVRENGSTGYADWAGTTDEKIKIAQTMTLTQDAKFVRVDVTVTNQSTAAVSDVRYLRTVDPDQGASFDTSNKIVKQGGASGALVAAYTTDGKAPLFFYATDARAVVSTYGFDNRDPYAATAYGAPQATGTTLGGDHAINIAFALGTLGAGGSTTLTYYMGLTDDLAVTVSAIGGTAPPPPTNIAPVAFDDAYVLLAGAALRGNVLTNDRDADGDALRAVVKTGPAHGSLSLAADGSFTYTANAGFVGFDSFTYAATDGAATDNATVRLTVNAIVPPPPPPTGWGDDPLLDKPGLINASSSADQTLTGAVYHNVFLIDVAARSGADTVTNFGASDVLALTARLYDGNGDGIINLANSVARVDGLLGFDTITLEGVGALRHLGTTGYGLQVYADADTRPAGAIESTVADNNLLGDAGDRSAQTFFFDTALDIDLGSDRIANFGNRDILVTTSRLPDGNNDGTVGFGSDSLLDLNGGAGAPGDSAIPGEVGTVAITGVSGDIVDALELDDAVVHNGVTYFVYSLDGSSAGLSSLTF